MASAPPPLDLPLFTADLPGTGGRIRATPDDFTVDEVPAYLPSGEGDHVWAWIEKRDLTTPLAAQRLADAAGVPARDVGWAGMKDRHAVTRQWLSLPPPARPETIAGHDGGGLRVLTVTRHRNKLKTGHLAGNRFALVIRDLDVDAEVAAERARAVLAALARAPGAPNWYGEQRFGKDGDNAAAGLALVRAGGKSHLPPRQRRFLVSALQSELFNRWLVARIADGLYREVVAGDLAQKRATGGMFTSTDAAVDTARLVAGEIVVTGPMFGAEMRGPPDGTAAQLREAAILAPFELGPASFLPLRAIAAGTRRPAAIAIGDPAVEVVVDDPDRRSGAIRVTFALPAGAYATAVLHEIMKRDNRERATWT